LSSTATGTALPTGTWNADAVHSHVGFSLKYNVGTFRGSFTGFEARLDVPEAGAPRLTGSVKAENIRVQDESLQAHLLSPEFFDVERTPEVRFESTSVARAGDSLLVTGDLTIRGTTLPVELRGTIADPATDAFGFERMHLTLEGSIDRTRYGFNWNMELPSGGKALADDVTLTAELYFTRA
jgi:polyisoprenoid-binding protein YceI